MLNKYAFEKVFLEAQSNSWLSSCSVDSVGKVYVWISKQSDKWDFIANLYKLNRKLELVEIYKKWFLFNINKTDISKVLCDFFFFLINQEKELYGFHQDYTPFYNTNNDIFWIDVKEQIWKKWKKKDVKEMFKKIKNINDIQDARFLLKIGSDIHSIKFKDEKNTSIDLNSICINSTI